MDEQEFAANFFNDEGFRAELKKDPESVLRAHGADLPDDVEIEVLESTTTKHYVVLPPLSDGSLSEGDLATVQGGCLYSVPMTGAECPQTYGCNKTTQQCFPPTIHGFNC